MAAQGPSTAKKAAGGGGLLSVLSAGGLGGPCPAAVSGGPVAQLVYLGCWLPVGEGAVAWGSGSWPLLYAGKLPMHIPSLVWGGHLGV